MYTYSKWQVCLLAHMQICSHLSFPGCPLEIPVRDMYGGLNLVPRDLPAGPVDVSPKLCGLLPDPS